jgi:hypothetical protein
MEPYRDPIIKKYIELIESKTKVFKRFYYGDPLRVPASLLPACIISKTETRVGPLTNSEDEHGIQMLITVITDIRRDLSDDTSLVAGISSLYNIIEGRNADYTLASDSLLHILRNNIGLDVANNLRTDLTTITRVDYGLVTGKREPEAWSVEGQIEFTCHFTQVR